MILDGISPQSLKMELIWANHREVEPDFQRMRFSVRDETACWYLERGGVRVRRPGAVVAAGEGMWLFPGESGSEIRFEPGSRIVSIRFRLLYPEGGRLFEQPEPAALESVPLLRAGRALVAAVEPCRAPGTFLLGRERISLPENLGLEARFHEWLAMYCRVMLGEGRHARLRSKRDERVTRALERLDRHPMREPFTEAELASACGIGARQLRRLMERETGLSPYAHYDRRRQELARHALRETSMPLKEIAYELGFRAPPHFSNWFRKRSGTPPRQFREAARS